MDDPTALRAALALLLCLVAWFVSFWWFSLHGWIVAALIAAVALWAAPPLP